MRLTTKRCGIVLQASLALMLAVLPGLALAKSASVADLDSASRADGNRKAIAMTVGEAIFKNKWPAEVFRVSANGIGSHVVIGFGLYGVKFHEPLTRVQFATEVSELVNRAFAAAPDSEEVDIWVVVPISVGKGVVVSGDLAKPTTRTVFAASIMRKDAAHLTPAVLLSRPDIFWDEDWAQGAFKKAS